MKIKLNGKADPTIPNHLSTEKLKAEPLRIPKGEPLGEITARLKRIRSYNETQEFKQHIVTRKFVEILLSKSGYDPKLAEKHGAGMTPEEIEEKFPTEKKKPSVD